MACTASNSKARRVARADSGLDRKSRKEKQVRRGQGLRLYRKVWSKVRNQFYDASRLSEWETWKDRFDAKIDSPESGASFAKKMLASLDDVYSNVYKREQSESPESVVTTTRVFENGVGYLRLADFQQHNTADQMKDALAELSSSTALILDLRGNSGGYVDAAFDSAALFLDDDRLITVVEDRVPKRSKQVRRLEKIVRFNSLETRYSTGLIKSEPRAQFRTVSLDKPLVVLIDEQTASAAEILTAALRDSRGATLIGRSTFGKGIGQTFHELPGDYELSVSDFRLLTPQGTWAGDGHRVRRRIRPHIEIRSRGRIYRSNLNRDKQLLAALDFLNSKSREQSAA